MAKKSTKPSAEKKPIGRPKITFDTAVRLRIAELYKQGLTDKEISKELGFSEATFYNLKSQYGSFLEALKESKDIPDDSVTASLFQRAMGYNAPATKIFYDSKTGRVVTHEYVQHYPPDVTAMIFWLKNRRPNLWREKREIEHSGKVENMSEEELMKLVKDFLKEEA